jgi:GT2 family glycosyltransferase
MRNMPSEYYPLVSIITVNFNQGAVTAAFLDSVRKLSYGNCEVIVVDNGSEEPPGAFIQEHYPEVRYLETGRNLGFSGGNNVGLRAARGEYFLLINNDTELEPDAVDRLLDHFNSDPAIGMVCPLIRYYDRPDLIQYAGYTRMHPVTARNQTIGQFEVDRGQYAQPVSTCFAHGAAMFTSRRVVEAAGLMPELFFLYYEELDWSQRIRQAGYRIDLEPRAVIFHKESVSVGKMSTLKTYYMTRNRILFMRRNAPLWSWLAFLAYWLAVVVPIHTLRYAAKGQADHLRAFYRAMGWHWRRQLPQDFAEAAPRLVF